MARGHISSYVPRFSNKEKLCIGWFWKTRFWDSRFQDFNPEWSLKYELACSSYLCSLFLCLTICNWFLLTTWLKKADLDSAWAMQCSSRLYHMLFNREGNNTCIYYIYISKYYRYTYNLWIYVYIYMSYVYAIHTCIYVIYYVEGALWCWKRVLTWVI